MDKKTLKQRVSNVFGGTRGLESILITNTNSADPNFIYLTDLVGGLFEWSMLLATKSKVILFTSPLEYELAREQLRNGIQIVNLDKKEKLQILIDAVKGKKIGINARFVPYDTYVHLKKRLKIKEFVDVSGAFDAARQVKGSIELDRIAAANRITKRAIAQVYKSLRVGMTEKEAAAEFEYLILKHGADGTSFPSIVCFGRNAALPHHGPDGTRLRYGDFVLIDVGVKLDNYCSDVTRTTIFGSDRRRIEDYRRKAEILRIVKHAQSLAIKSIHAGQIGEKPHLIAEKHINSAANGRYKGTFIHSLGHSIGIEVHDGEGRFLTPGSKLILKPGMVTSVEPGIYVPGFGGARFEDDIVVTKKGARIL